MAVCGSAETIYGCKEKQGAELAHKRAKLIPDVPAEEDAFFGAGHARVAGALAEAVAELSGEDAAIGLEGPWGAGKSTVIHLASKRLGEKEGGPPYCVFTFDLWLHNPNLLKLAFMEEFLAWAKAKDFIDEETQKEFLTVLADKRITSRVHNNRMFGLSGIFYLLLLPLLPLAYAWLSPLAFSGKGISSVIFPAIGWSTDPAYIASLIVFALYIVFAAALIGSKLKNRGQGWRHAVSSASRMFTRDSDFDEVDQSVRERNPTNEEFQTHFRALVSRVQSKKGRMVFVFDNIDRLSVDAVPLVWSEMRSIYALKSRGASHENSSILAIVPFDREYIQDAFGAGGELESPRMDRPEQLLKKTFDITLRVAPPLSTDWREFLDRMIDRAFEEQLDAADKYELFKLLDISKQATGLPPTPREIVSYVNNIGMLWNQWAGEIPVAHMAIYVLQSGQITAKSIRSGGLMSVRFEQVIRDKDFPRSLAALHFNVEPKHAYQVLLAADIERIAAGEDGKAFVDFSTSNGFKETLPEVIQQRAEQWAQDGGIQLANFARNLAQEGIEGDYLREVWERIADAFDHLNECVNNRPVHYESFSAVLSNLPAGRARSRASRLASWYAAGLAKEEERTLLDGRNWLRFFGFLYNGLVREGDASAAQEFQKSISVPKGVAFQLGVCAAAASLAMIDSSLFRPVHTAPDLQSPAVGLVKTDPGALNEIFRVRPWFASAEISEALVTAICDRLSSDKLEKAGRPELAELLCRLRSEHDPRRKLVPAILARANDGSLVAHAAMAFDEGDRLTGARLAWLIMDAADGRSVPDRPSNHPHLGDLNTFYPAYEKHIADLDPAGSETGEIARLAAVSKGFTRWMGYAIDEGRPEVFRQVFARIATDEDYGELEVVRVVGAFDEIDAILDEDAVRVFLSKLGGWSHTFDTHFAGRNCTKIPVPLISRIADDKVESLSKLTELSDACLSSLGEEDWGTVLIGGEPGLLDLFIARLRSGYRPVSGGFQSKLLECTVTLVEGKASLPVEPAAWNDVYLGIRPDSLRKFARDLLVKLKDVTTTGDGVDTYLAACERVADLMPLADFPDIALDQVVFRAIGKPSAACTGYLGRNSSLVAKAIAGAKEDVASRIREALEALRDTGEEDALRATAWARDWQIKLSPATPPESSETV